MALDPRSALLDTLSTSQRRDYEAFETQVLEECLKRRRKDDATSPFVIDKRNDLLGHAGRETLVCPDGESYGGAGGSTSDRATAERWARSYYIPRLWQLRAMSLAQPGSEHATVSACAQRYADTLIERVQSQGRSIVRVPKKYRSRISCIRSHVVPQLGPMLMVALTAPVVRAVVENLEITERGADGKSRRRPAAAGTKHNVLVCLRAIWRHCYPDDPMPFAGVDIRVRPSDEEIDEDAEDAFIDVYDIPKLQVQVRQEEGKGGLAPEEITAALAGAMRRDYALNRRPNMQALGFMPIMSHLFALLIATGCRISEAVRIRWCDINLDAGFILVRQSKRANQGRRKKKPKYRIVPLQESLVPWLIDLATESDIADLRSSRDYIIRVVRERRGRPVGTGTLINRCEETLLYAGCKPANYSTHWGRATHATIAMFSPAVKNEEYRHFLGHIAFKGSTQEYIATVLALLRPEHRTYIKLPTPGEIRARLPEFVPVKLNWKERRTVQKRTRAAKEERRESRLRRRSLGTKVIPPEDNS